jgi:hypothetical protein
MTQAARAATSPELAYLRTPGDWTRAFLAIYKPNVIYAAVLSAVPTSNDMVGQISFSGGTGTLTDVRAEMTLWVGTTSGARNLGVCRIRKAPIAGTFYISYNSEVNWAGAATVYLTVVDHAMLSRKPVLMSGGVVLMDGEHAYSDQHEDFDPVPVMSCHSVGTLVEDEVAFVWDASHSWVFDSTIESYLWEAPGSLSIDDDTSATPIITYDSAGNHPVYCTVTAANGKSATGIQFAFRFDADHKPHVGEIQPPSADYDTGGWEFKARMFSDADPTEIIEGALCVLFADDYYGATKQSIGQLEHRENIICWGWIAGDENIDWDAEASSVEFAVQGPQYWLKEIEVDPIALAMGTTATWGVMPGLTVDRYLWHTLHWRSNATALLNITLTGDTRYAPDLGSGDGPLWSQMSEVAWRKIFGRIGCDRYGRFFAMIDPQCVPESDRTWATVMTLTKKDWREKVGVKRKSQRRLGMLSTSGWVTDISGAVSTLYSLAMGHIHAHYGGGDIIDQLLASSQAQFNELTGLYMGWKNSEYDFDFSLSQNNRMVDLFPNQFLATSMAAGDTTRGIAYAGNLIPRSISLNPDADAGCWSTEISCEAETFAELAVNGDIPASAFESAEDAAGWDDLSFPPMSDFPSMPPLKNLTYPSPTEEPNNHPDTVVLYSSNYGVLYTTTFNEDSPVWYFMNSGLEPGDYAGIQKIIVTPSGAIFLQTSTQVFATRSIGGTFTQIADIADFTNGYILDIAVDPHKSETIAIIGGISKRFPYGDNSAGVKLVLATPSGIIADQIPTMRINPQWAAGIVFANNQWFVSGNGDFTFASPCMWRFTEGGSPIDPWNGYYTPGIDAQGRSLTAAGTQDLLFYWEGAGGLYKVTADGQTFASQSLSPQVRQGVAFSPTGTFGMGANTTTPSKTSDGGSTWASAAGVIPIGPTVWENCGDNFRWIFGGGNVIRLTMDWGATIIDKMGNLTQLAALINITGIRFIE